MTKKIWITLGVAGWVFLVTFISWRAYEAKIHKAYLQGIADVNEQEIYLRGVNDAVSQVIRQAQQGKVIINTNNGQLVLVLADPNTK